VRRWWPRSGTKHLARADSYRGPVIRRQQQGQQKLRRAQRQAAKQLDTDQGAYKPPDRDECHDKQWEMAADDANTVRAQFNIWRRSGRLVDFVINIQVLTSEGWEQVEYFDCCHGYCHLHPRNETEPRSIKRLDVVADVQDAYRRVQPIIEERLRIIQGEG
jgi:hypothetical protein